jgi:hypothetical protein
MPATAVDVLGFAAAGFSRDDIARPSAFGAVVVTFEALGGGHYFAYIGVGAAQLPKLQPVKRQFRPTRKT